jgi:hypothetical protein
LAEDNMRLLLVIRRTLTRWLTTAERNAEANGGGIENDAAPKFQMAKVIEFLP